MAVGVEQLPPVPARLLPTPDDSSTSHSDQEVIRVKDQGLASVAEKSVATSETVNKSDSRQALLQPSLVVQTK